MKAVIFCGGVGTRMWPMSRKSFPKQFQPIVGRKSMFQQTLKRVKLGFTPENIFVSTGEEYAHYVREQAPEIPHENIIAEPERKDNLGAVGYATMYLHKKFGDTIMAAVWGADHLVEEEQEFVKAFKLAGKLCKKYNKIVKIDVKPTFPSIYNGWVEIGEEIENVEGFTVFKFVRFVEKPDIKTAKKMFKSWRYLIHTGYNVWSTQQMLNYYQEYSPSTYEIIQKIGDAINTSKEKQVLKTEYAKLEKNSIDFAIFEKLPADSQLEIPTDMGWIDVGTWELLFNGLNTNNNGENVIQANLEAIDTANSLIYAPENKLVATIGVKNLIVVDTSDALLVCDLKNSSQVKELYEILKKKRPEAI